MRIRLVHNPKSGSALDEHELIDAIRAAGHEVVYHSSKDDAAWERLEADPCDLVAVAGGDGTVGSVSKRLAGRGVPILVFPGGTANNLATALGARAEVGRIAHLNRARRQPCDVGTATWPGGSARFLESVGGGIFARMAVKLDRQEQQGKIEFQSNEHELTHAIEVFRQQLRRAQPRKWGVELDGQDHSGRYLLVEAMNIPCIGPNLWLAPKADMSDGLLDVVLVSEADRGRLDEHLSHLHAGTIERSQPMLIHRVRRAVLEPPVEEPIHIDDQMWEPAPQAHGPITLELQQHALTYLVP